MPRVVDWRDWDDLGVGNPWASIPGAPSTYETATLQLLIGEGQIEGLVDGLKSVYLDGTPILNSDGSKNFKGIALALVSGTNTQPAVKGIGGVESEVPVNVQVPKASPVTRSITSNPSAVRVRIALPALKVIGTDGSSQGHSVTIKIERQNASYNGGAWEEVPLEENGVISGGPFSSKFTRSFRVDLPASGTWQVRVTRVSNDDLDAYRLSQTWWEAYTEIIDARLRYPNSAVLSLRVNANQFRSIPKVSLDLKLSRIQVPANYNPLTRAYATSGLGTTGGAWDGTFKEAWSDNPAWVFYDTATKTRYGAGSFLDASALDKWTLYTIGQWCDTMVADGKGGTEPRLACNLYMQNQQNAIKALGQLASIFWGVIYYTSGLVVPVADADTAAVAVFNSSNVIGGKFTYEGTARSARHTAAVVKFTNPDLGWEPDTAVHEDAEGIARFGYNPLDLNALGCTSHGQALRLARWSILTELLADETISFGSGLEGSTVKPGDVFQVHDQFRAGNVRFGGRVATGATTTVIPLDAPVTFGAGTHYLKIKNASGVLETRTVTTGAGTVSSLTVSSAFSVAPPAGAVWLLQAGSTASLWRCLSIRKGDGIVYDITALKHDPAKYALLALASGDVIPRSTAPRTSPAPAGLTAGIATRILNDKQVQTLEANWTLDGALGYQAEAALHFGSWQPMAVSGASAVLSNVQPGEWRVRVYGVWPSGLSPATTYQMTVSQPEIIPPWIESALTPSVVADGVTTQFLVGVPAKRTNLLPYSQDFGNAAWAKTGATITTDAAAAPDGTLTADKIAETAVTSGHYAAQTVTLPAGAFTISAYMKAAERTMGWIQLGSTYVAVDLSTGTLAAVVGGGTASIMDAGGGIWRVSLTATVTAGGKLCLVGAATGTTAAPVYSYAGAAGSGIYAWGAQLNSGSVADAYLATLADPVSDYGITCEDWRGVWTMSAAPRTNAVAYSEPLLSQCSIKSAGITQGAITDYGLTNGLTFPASSGIAQYTGFNVGATANGDLFAASIFVKMADSSAPIPSNSQTSGDFRIQAGGVDQTCVFTVTHLGSGLYRVDATGTVAGRVNDVWGVAKYVNNNPTRGFTVTGYQIARGTNTPGRYIKTSGSAVTVTDITTSNGLATLSPAPLQGAILRGVSSNASQQASLAAPAIVADHAAISLPSATYPAGRLVYQTAGTPAGTFWQVNAAGTAWQTPALGVASLVGQLIAGQIAAGAINVSHLAADAIQSSDYTEDGYGDPSAGFRAGIGQVAPIKCGPLGLQIGRAKLREENLVVNRISNGIFYSSLAPWVASGTPAPVYTATSRVSLTGGAAMGNAVNIVQNATVSFNSTGSLSQVIKAPDPINNRPAVLKVWYLATRTDSGGNTVDNRSYSATLQAYFTDLTTGSSESLAGSASCTVDDTWRQASITVTSSIPTAGDYLLRLALNITGSDTNSGSDFEPGEIRLTLVVDEIDLSI